MRIVLSTSPHVRHAAVLQADFRPDSRVMYTFAPVGLLSLMAVLRQRMPNADVTLYDLNRRVLSGDLPMNGGLYGSVAAEIVRLNPDVVGFMTECDSYHHVLQVAAEVRRRAPHCRIVLGGPHASAVARRTLEVREEIDAVVIGEGELSFPDLLLHYELRLSGEVPGTIRRGASGELIHGGPQQLVESLDSLPIPLYECYQPDPGEEVFIEVGRGCPFQCAFCSTAPYWRRRHRVKSPTRILEEVQLVRNLYGATRVHFTHDLFTTRRDWVEALCDVLTAAGSPVTWTCSARTDTVDTNLLSRMRSAGCDAIYFGLESGSPRMLREIRKEIPLSQSLRVIADCADVGITPNAGVIVGFPSESDDSVRDTLDLYEKLLRLGSRPTHVFGYCPFADSSMYAQLRELRCNGHFVDLPLGPSADANNRDIVASDGQLFGSYFRPPLHHVIPGDSEALDGIDEFSPLVEAALYPALACSKLVGGMYELFVRWCGWVKEQNDKRGVAKSRIRYGSPTMFASFVADQLERSGAPAHLNDACRAVRTNLRAIEQVMNRGATAMASHRSVALPRVRQVSLKSALHAGDIISTIQCKYDVVPVLSGLREGELARKPTYLVWHVSDTGALQLLEIDQLLFAVLKEVRRPGKHTVSGLLRKHVDSRSDASSAVILASIDQAAAKGLVTAT